MPELPEAECIRRDLERILVGQSMRLDRVERYDIVGSLTHPRGQRSGRSAAVALDELLDDCVVDCVLRKGKQIAIGAQGGRWLIIRLGMSGQLLFGRSLDAKLDHVHIRWTIDTATPLGFRDARRFGSVIPCRTRDELDAHWQKLGPDALSIESGDLLNRLRSRKTAVKACLLDQQVVAGIGNIYADESLFRACVHPQTIASTLRREQVELLAESVRDVMKAAIKGGGTTLRDYRSPSGASGSYQSEHLVYGRRGEPCRTCGNTLVGKRLVGRASVWCPTCQRRRIK
jgi:formamidopyrimidine-DNA glycosylase